MDEQDAELLLIFLFWVVVSLINTPIMMVTWKYANSLYFLIYVLFFWMISKPLHKLLVIIHDCNSFSHMLLSQLYCVMYALRHVYLRTEYLTFSSIYYSRFWLVWCTTRACISCRASCSKTGCFEDWALPRLHEWGSLLGDLLCSSAP